MAAESESNSAVADSIVESTNSTKKQINGTLTPESAPIQHKNTPTSQNGDENDANDDADDGQWELAGSNKLKKQQQQQQQQYYSAKNGNLNRQTRRRRRNSRTLASPVSPVNSGVKGGASASKTNPLKSSESATKVASSENTTQNNNSSEATASLPESVTSGDEKAMSPVNSSSAIFVQPPPPVVVVNPWAKVPAVKPISIHSASTNLDNANNANNTTASNEAMISPAPSKSVVVSVTSTNTNTTTTTSTSNTNTTTTTITTSTPVVVQHKKAPGESSSSKSVVNSKVQHQHATNSHGQHGSANLDSSDWPSLSDMEANSGAASVCSIQNSSNKVGGPLFFFFIEVSFLFLFEMGLFVTFIRLKGANFAL